jgi:hypothetical protein
LGHLSFNDARQFADAEPRFAAMIEISSEWDLFPEYCINNKMCKTKFVGYYTMIEAYFYRRISATRAGIELYDKKCGEYTVKNPLAAAEKSTLCSTVQHYLENKI